MSFPEIIHEVGERDAQYCVIEDNDRDAKILEQCLTRYATQNHLQFQVAHFSSALKFINAYKSNYDLIFMDIEMPLMSGMEAAKALRQIDRGVTVVVNSWGYILGALLSYVPFCVAVYMLFARKIGAFDFDYEKGEFHMRAGLLSAVMVRLRGHYTTGEKRRRSP
ncbi:hypothetical protein B5G34_05845 [Flavonifractor sp. An82]|nr:hypothetical protein B5G34_05845 [Flavonifractor sp. An82]